MFASNDLACTACILSVIAWLAGVFFYLGAYSKAHGNSDLNAMVKKAALTVVSSAVGLILSYLGYFLALVYLKPFGDL
jgi:hypothetical protein